MKKGRASGPEKILADLMQTDRQRHKNVNRTLRDISKGRRYSKKMKVGLITGIHKNSNRDAITYHRQQPP